MFSQAKMNIILFLTVLSFSSTLMAQSSASASATVTANLKKGLSISNFTGALNFGDIILTGSAQTPTVAPGSGVRFDVTGHPNKNITITFAGISLDNDAWVLANGGTNGTLAFTPTVHHTGNSSTYAAGTAVTSGNVVALVNTTGDGRLYLWLGGSLAVGASQPHGDYTGSFTMNVAY
jgi:hypothetical protein